MLLRSAFCLFVLFGASPALADDPAEADDVARAADACQPDIHRLCDAFFPDETLVARCLVDRRADLSTACAQALADPAAAGR